ncbi:hypothetical protein QFC21_004093 [Naganishia friedmannii]|uniref:Uncharacterized protein n=1 Tax=Naganishia friedmannii TaxID=89922 RepID=A0ACC2VJG7_9TREE|nr:hypothetical protein QFC21_004093 [Naganishia friedmannii]
MPASRRAAPSARSLKANSTIAAVKATAPAKTAEQIAQEEHDALVTSASKLIHAVTYAPVAEVKRILKEGAPTWYQEESMGWNCLHFAAERGDADIVKACLGSGAVWNAKMLHHVLQAAKGDESMEHDAEADGANPTATEEEHSEKPGESSTSHMTSTGMTLRHEDKTSAGDNLEFMKSKLVWEMGDDGKERVCDADGNGVMMGWEEPLMKEHVRLMCNAHPKMQEGATEGLNILNIGYGLGIIDDMFQGLTPRLFSHTVIEGHPDVIQHIKKRGFDQKEGVRILEGRWQDWCKDDKLEDLLKGTEESGGGFDLVFIDTFAEGYEELKDFFDILPNILASPESVFSFWNGLGATIRLIQLLNRPNGTMSLLNESVAEATWKGIKRKYWDLRVYKLPIAAMNI